MSRHRPRNYHKGLEYVRTYPGRQKWLNQCLRCQHVGHKPDLPEVEKPRWGEDNLGVATEYPHQLDNDYYFFKYLQEHFDPLHLDENGLCPICADS